MTFSIEEIYQMDYISADNRGSETDTYARPNQSTWKVIVPKLYTNEIKALCDYAGVESLTPGMTIRMTLQEMLSIVPRKRPRIESYKTLINFLKDEMNVDLILTSRKTK